MKDERLSEVIQLYLRELDIETRSLKNVELKNIDPHTDQLIVTFKDGHVAKFKVNHGY